MKYPKLRELKEAIKALIQGPCTTKYPFEPHVPAARFRGKPIPYEKECIGCMACAQVCPANAIEVIDNLSTRTLVWHYDDCIFCGQCEANCTTKKGVKLSQEFDLATLDRKTLRSEDVVKQLIVCTSCGEIIGPVDQVLWIANKLGPMAYGNVSLWSTLQQQDMKTLGASMPIDTKQPVTTDFKKRPDMFKLQCPKCKYLILQFDEFNK
jgi:hydrogenase-4 component H